MESKTHVSNLNCLGIANFVINTPSPQQKRISEADLSFFHSKLEIILEEENFLLRQQPIPIMSAITKGFILAFLFLYLDKWHISIHIFSLESARKKGLKQQKEKFAKMSWNQRCGTS